jgi:hypothetical protein
MTSDCRSACSSHTLQDPRQGGRMASKAQSPSAAQAMESGSSRKLRARRQSEVLFFRHEW